MPRADQDRLLSDAARSVRHQHGHRHRPDAAGNRGERRRRAQSLAKATSPTSSSRLPSPFRPSPGTRLDADIDHDRAGLDPIAADHFRPANRRNDDSARATAGRSRVREWAMVTVALRDSSNCAIGLPTMFERPTTTASAPARSRPSAAIAWSSSSMEPAGVHGTSARSRSPIDKRLR